MCDVYLSKREIKCYMRKPGSVSPMSVITVIIACTVFQMSTVRGHINSATFTPDRLRGDGLSMFRVAQAVNKQPRNLLLAAIWLHS